MTERGYRRPSIFETDGFWNRVRELAQAELIVIRAALPYLVGVVLLALLFVVAHG